MKIKLMYAGVGVFVGALFTAIWFLREGDIVFLFAIIIIFGLAWTVLFFNNKKCRNWLLDKFKRLGNWLHNEFTNFIMYAILTPGVIFATFLALSIGILFWPNGTFSNKSTAIILLLTGAAIFINTAEAYARNRFDYYSHLQNNYKKKLRELVEDNECLQEKSMKKEFAYAYNMQHNWECSEKEKERKYLIDQINYYEEKKQNILKKIKLSDEQRDLWG